MGQVGADRPAQTHPETVGYPAPDTPELGHQAPHVKNGSTESLT